MKIKLGISFTCIQMNEVTKIFFKKIPYGINTSRYVSESMLLLCETSFLGSSYWVISIYMC